MSCKASRGLCARASRLLAFAAAIGLLDGCATVDARRLGPIKGPDATGRYDVIVIGAGLAGLSAAHELIRAHRSVLVLEATDRIGGRAFADKTTFSAPVDLGGAWIHGVSTNPLAAMVDLLGYERAGTELSGDVWFENGFLGKKDYDDWTAALERFHESLKGKDEPAAKFLPQEGADARFRDLLAANAGPFEASEEATRVSAGDVHDFLAEDDDLVPRGIGTMVEEFGRDVPVRLNARVSKITYAPQSEARNSQDVIVEVAPRSGSGGGTFRARRVIVTVSTGVLARQDGPYAIAFDPPLPDWKRDAIRGLPMGLLNKVILEFDSDFSKFTHDTSWVLYQGPRPADGGAPDTMAFVMKVLGKPLLVAFYGGDRAHDRDDRCIGNQGAARTAQCDQQAIDHVLSVLRTMYGGGVGQPVRARVTHWASEGWVLGSYSAALPGWTWNGPERAHGDEEPPPGDAHEAMARPVNQVVFFAGEACARPIYNGSFPGAYESGRQAARRIIDDLETRRLHRPHFEEPPAADAAKVSAVH